jgi:hypothetical protein
LRWHSYRRPRSAIRYNAESDRKSYHFHSTDTFEKSFDDDNLPDSLPSAAASQPITRDDARLQRLEEYESAGLAKYEPLEASLTFINADLMSIANSLGKAVKDSLATAPTTAENFRQVQPGLNDYLRVTGQVQRFASGCHVQ